MPRLVKRLVPGPHLLAAGVLVFCALWPASHAEASGTPLFVDDSDIGKLYLLASDVGFGGIDLVFAMIDRPMPPWLSIVELSVASIGVPALALAGNLDNTPIALAALASFAWFGIHSVTHLGAYPAFKRKVLAERERRRKLEKDQHSRRGGLSIAPMSSGSGIRVHFTF